MQAEWIPCGWPMVNYMPGRLGTTIDMITLHWMAGYLQPSIDRFKNPTSGVSAHRLASPTRLVEMVHDGDIAYHAGNWTVNKRSLGLEHEGGYPIPGGGLADVAEATIQKSIQQCTDWCQQHKINPLEQVDAQWWNPVTRQVEWHKVYRIDSHHNVCIKQGNTQCSGTLPVERIRNSVAINLGYLRPVEVPPVPTAPASDLNFVAHPCTVKISGTAGTGLNVRPLPNTTKATVGNLPDGQSTTALGYTVGESVGGNTRWWKLGEGRYVSSFYAAEVTDQPAPAAPKPVAVYSFDTDLAPGSSGDARVADLQRALKKLGYFPASLDATGNYYGATGNAVLAFQKATDDPDRPGTKIMPQYAAYSVTFGAGWFGPKTRSALNAKRVTKP